MLDIYVLDNNNNNNDDDSNENHNKLFQGVRILNKIIINNKIINKSVDLLQ